MSQLALGPCPGDKAARQVKCGPVGHGDKRESKAAREDEKAAKGKQNQTCLLFTCFTGSLLRMYFAPNEHPYHIFTFTTTITRHRLTFERAK